MTTLQYFDAVDRNRIWPVKKIAPEIPKCSSQAHLLENGPTWTELQKTRRNEKVLGGEANTACWL